MGDVPISFREFLNISSFSIPNLTHLTQNVPKVALKDRVELRKPSGRCVTFSILNLILGARICEGVKESPNFGFGHPPLLRGLSCISLRAE